MSSKIIKIKISQELSGLRLDKALHLSLSASPQSASSRSMTLSTKQFKKLVESGKVLNQIHDRVKASHKVQAGELYICELTDIFSTDHPQLTANKKSTDPNQLDQRVAKKNKSYWEIVWQVSKQAYQDLTSQEQSFIPVDIIYEDEYFMVVNKACGVPTSPTIDPKRLTLFHYVLGYLTLGQNDSSSVLTMPYLRNLHRLDKGTSGLVLFARQSTVIKDLAYLLERGMINKRYYVICHRPSSGPLFDFIEDQTLSSQEKNSIFKFEAYLQDLSKLKSNPLALKKYSADTNRDTKRDHQKQSYWTVVNRNGLYSRTDFSLLGLSKNYLFLEAHLYTGRTHQIRVHLQALNAPIVGDSLYGKANEQAKRLYLHAYQLGFSSKFASKQSQNYKFSAQLPDLFHEEFPQLLSTSTIKN